jgi:hypothetical protein
MDKSKFFFFFKEHGLDDFPSILDAPQNMLSPGEAEMIARYLESSPIWVASPGIVHSHIDPAEIAGTLSIRTDGHWAWQDTMAYYVRKFRVSPPAEFVSEVQQKGGTPPLEFTVNVGSLEFPEF